MVLVGMLTRDTLDRRWAALERLGRHFADVLDGLVVLKTFGRRQEDGLRAIGRRHRVETMKTLRIAFLSSLVLDLVATLSVALVAVSVGLRVVEDELSLQRALLILLLAPEAYLPVRQLGMSYHESTEGAQAVADALDLLDHPRHAGQVQPSSLDLAGDLVLERVVVQHEGRALPALSVDGERIRPGELVAIAGPSGSGKSTLLDVLLGFVQPTSGRVLLGALDLTEVDPESWRRTIAWVPQVPVLIEGTVADNVRMASSAAARADVLRALSDSGLDELGPERWVSESAGDVSGGERRRIGVARALLRVRTEGARLMLLDEPTAGLDAGTEAAVLDVLRDLPITVVVVSHRPEIIAAADRVVRLKSPELVTA
jgi:ABC-type transport system involved in cytochrome bd biosynthesis fused ATPase/permease subunit